MGVEGPGAPHLRNRWGGLERGTRSLPTKAEEGPKGAAASVNGDGPKESHLIVYGGASEGRELFAIPKTFSQWVSEFRPHWWG